MPGKEGMIPNYILKTLEEEALEIKFNLDDLSTLYDERNIKIDEESTFYEIIKLCKKENAAVIQIIDRVFYTRIECYNSDKKSWSYPYWSTASSAKRLSKDIVSKGNC